MKMVLISFFLFSGAYADPSSEVKQLREASHEASEAYWEATNTIF